MRTLLTLIIALFLTLSLSGQGIMSGVVGSKSAASTPAFDGGMISNGDFSGGATDWSVTNNFAIADGKATDAATSEVISVLSQSSANMVSPLVVGSSYSLTFTISGGTGDYCRMNFYDQDDTALGLPYTVYANGTHTVTVTVPAYGAGGGFQIKSTIGAGSGFTSFSIDNISLVEQ